MVCASTSSHQTVGVWMLLHLFPALLSMGRVVSLGLGFLICKIGLLLQRNAKINCNDV